MLRDRRTPEEEVCPVRDEFLGELYRAGEDRVSALVATVRPDIRALLALYCYRRSHLHTRGLAIAASCDQDDLVRSGGHVGALLFARSREAPSPAPIVSAFIARRTITLATGPLRKLPIDEGSKEEDYELV
jgi:hypothetical protein